jgi:hypothetical protein
VVELERCLMVMQPVVVCLPDLPGLTHLS